MFKRLLNHLFPPRLMSAEYSFCTSMWGSRWGSSLRWHIRKLSDTEPKYTGEVGELDTRALCGATVFWDLPVKIDTCAYHVVNKKMHYVCPNCQIKYQMRFEL